MNPIPRDPIVKQRQPFLRSIGWRGEGKVLRPREREKVAASRMRAVGIKTIFCGEVSRFTIFSFIAQASVGVTLNNT